MRYELSDDEWTAIKPMLPNKPRGVPRVNDRRFNTIGHKRTYVPQQAVVIRSPRRRGRGALGGCRWRAASPP